MKKIVFGVTVFVVLIIVISILIEKNQEQANDIKDIISSSDMLLTDREKLISQLTKYITLNCDFEFGSTSEPCRKCGLMSMKISKEKIGAFHYLQCEVCKFIDPIPVLAGGD